MAYKPLLILAGGSGYLGRLLIDSLKNQYSFLVLGRGRVSDINASYLQYPTNPSELASHLDGALALINLAGKSVDCRYTEKNKAEILNSRVSTTEYLGKAMAFCQKPPQVWVNLSSATIYPDSDTLQTELSPTPGGNFSEDVCLAWEKTFYDAHIPGTRKVALRCGLVFGKNGGAFPVLSKLSKLCLGGKQGAGSQYMSILHEADFTRAMEHVIHQRSMGSYNLCIPQPIQNNAFMKLLASYHTKLPQISQTPWMIKLGAMLLQTEAELVLKSRCVIPERLLNEGFQFNYETPEDILHELNDQGFQSAENESASGKTGNFDLASSSLS